MHFPQYHGYFHDQNSHIVNEMKQGVILWSCFKNQARQVALSGAKQFPALSMSSSRVVSNFVLLKYASFHYAFCDV